MRDTSPTFARMWLESGTVVRLNKSLHGLSQALRAWHDQFILVSNLKDSGFEQYVRFASIGGI